MIRLLILLGAILCLLNSCVRRFQTTQPEARALASASWPGGHFLLQDDNSLRILVGFEETEISNDSTEGMRTAYGQRPLQLPDQAYAPDHELLQGPDGWLATCRRDGYLEVWRDENPNVGFTSFGEQYTPLPIWLPGQYPAAESVCLLEERILTTAAEQSVVCLDYFGRGQWSFLMGAPARLLVDEDKSQIYAASGDGYLYALNLQGELLWQHETASHLAALLQDGNIICVEEDGSLRCLDAAGGELWQHPCEQEPTELRSCGGLLWYVESGSLACLDEAGKSLDCAWDTRFAVIDLLPGPDGQLFVSGLPRQSARLHTGANPIWSIDRHRLFCFTERAELLWQLPEMTPGHAIIPGHNAQCWLVDLDPFAYGNNFGSGQPQNMLLVGLYSESVRS